MKATSDFGVYTHAIVCGVPNSFVNAIGSKERIELESAKKEHSLYVEYLRKSGVNVIQILPSEKFPDCPFVEDTAIICDGAAFITRPGHPSRMEESEIVKNVLRDQLNIPITQILDSNAFIDGGDVLFTGHEFFVGISDRTNVVGANQLAKCFPEYPVTPIHLPLGVLHLKQLVSMAGPGLICCSTSQSSQEIIRRIEREASSLYKTITVPDELAANCVYVNGNLIHRAEFPKSLTTFEEKLDFRRLPIEIYNMSKPQACLTSMSLLIHKKY